MGFFSRRPTVAGISYGPHKNKKGHPHKNKKNHVGPLTLTFHSSSFLSMMIHIFISPFIFIFFFIPSLSTTLLLSCCLSFSHFLLVRSSIPNKNVAYLCLLFIAFLLNKPVIHKTYSVQTRQHSRAIIIYFSLLQLSSDIFPWISNNGMNYMSPFWPFKEHCVITEINQKLGTGENSSGSRKMRWKDFLKYKRLKIKIIYIFKMSLGW